MTVPPNQPQQGSPLSYASVALTVQDVEHLKVLSICWWVLAGMQCLGICGGVVYIVLGILFGSGILHNNEPTPAPFAIIFSCAGVFIVVLAAIVAWLAYLVGRSLKERRRIVLCYVMAGVACLSIPLGTALGIFTFIVLARPSVKANFR